jgi:hypothetical protein
MPSQQRSGVSATVGLVMVIGLLLISGTLAVSGGGILSGGGRLGVDTDASPSPGTGQSGTATSAPVEPGQTAEPGTGENLGTVVTGQSFDYTCDAAGIRDATKGKWTINQFLVGKRDEFDRITWELTKRGRNNKEATEVVMEWMTPREARDQLGAPRVAGQRAIVITIDGGADINRNQLVDSLFLDREGVTAVKGIAMFEGDDGKVGTVVGVSPDGCARLSAPNFKKKNSKVKKAKIFLDVQTTPEDTSAG